MDNSTPKKPGGPSGTAPRGTGGGASPAGRKPAARGAKPYSDKRPASQGAKPYGEKRAYGENRPYSEKKTYPEKRTYSDQKPGSEKKPFSEQKPYPERKSFSDHKPYSDQKPYPERKSFSDKKPYSDQKPYSERKSFSDQKPNSEQKPFSERKHYEKKSFSDRKPYPNSRPYPNQRPNFEKKPIAPVRTEEAAVTEQQLQVLVSAIATEPVTSLSALAAHAKKRAARETLERIFADRTVLYNALSAPEPKARKNAARVLGAFANERDTEALVLALQTEQTRFVIPSILLALGAIANSRAGEAILAFVPPIAADETEEKHVADIVEALEKAKAALTRDIPLPPRTRLSQPREVLLVPPVGFGQILHKETTSRGFVATLLPDGVHVTTDQIKTLQELRCAQELLLPLGSNLPIDAEQLAALADPVLTRPYRIELRAYSGDRAALIRTVSSALGGGDNPSRYADELRIVCNNDKCDLFIRPRDVPDTRFAYRLRALPASIHPVQAACLARYALSFVSAARPRTLDPFCGSGTLLLELERVVSTGLIGVDVSERALDAARENAAAAHSSARFVHKDILKFEPRDPFDLILSNMPFGNRVGTHSVNETLYRDFVHALPKLLASGGIAVLYTMEHKLLTTCLKAEPSLSLAEELTTEAGGLNPRVTVVRRA